MIDDGLTDDRPVIDAPTAEELSGEISVVRTPTNRSVARERRRRREERRRRRRGVLIMTLAVVLAAAGGLLWWQVAGDGSDVEPQVSGVSVVNTTSTIPAEPTTLP